MEQSMPRKRTSEYAVVFCKAHTEIVSRKQCQKQAFPFEAQAFAGFNILKPSHFTPHHNPLEAGYFLWILLRGFSECFLLVHSTVLPNWDFLPLTQMKLTAWPWAAALLGLGCPRAICDILSIHGFSSVSLSFQVCLAYFAVGSSSKIAL